MEFTKFVNLIPRISNVKKDNGKIGNKTFRSRSYPPGVSAPPSPLWVADIWKIDSDEAIFAFSDSENYENNLLRSRNGYVVFDNRQIAGYITFYGKNFAGNLGEQMLAEGRLLAAVKKMQALAQHQCLFCESNTTRIRHIFSDESSSCHDRQIAGMARRIAFLKESFPGWIIENGEAIWPPYYEAKEKADAFLANPLVGHSDQVIAHWEIFSDWGNVSITKDGQIIRISADIWWILHFPGYYGDEMIAPRKERFPLDEHPLVLTFEPPTPNPIIPPPGLEFLSDVLRHPACLIKDIIPSRYEGWWTIEMEGGEVLFCKTRPLSLVGSRKVWEHLKFFGAKVPYPRGKFPNEIENWIEIRRLTSGEYVAIIKMGGNPTYFKGYIPIEVEWPEAAEIIRRQVRRMIQGNLREQEEIFPEMPDLFENGATYYIVP